MKKILYTVLLSLMIMPVPGLQAGWSVSLQTEPEGLFDVYEQNRKLGTANYITVDFLLLAYSMLRQQDIQNIEQESVMPAFTALVKELAKELNKKKDPVSMANRDFTAVLQALLTGKKQVSKAADAKRAQAELELVLAATGIASSPLWGYSLDYSQFKPRGYYTHSPEQSRYFQAMRYGSLVLFAVKESKATGIDAPLADRLTAQGLQLAGLIKKNAQSWKQYTTINEQLAFRMGGADDLLIDDLLAVIDQKTANTQEARAQLFKLAEEKNRKPRILANLVDRNHLEKDVTAADVLTGWRLFPQRYAPDSAFFQELVAPESGVFTGTGKPFGLATINGKPAKGFVSGYELMAALGSSVAREKIKTSEEMKFNGYDTVNKKGEQQLAGAAGLDALHIALLSELYNCQEKENSSRLTSGLAFWTWQRYVNLLYAKQSMTMVGKGFSFSPARKGSTIEPAVSVYTTLLRISKEYASHSGIRGAAAWQEFAEIVNRCIELSTKVRLQWPLTVVDDDFLNELDKQLLNLTGGKDHPIVVDIHTEPNSQLVVEEGSGLPVITEMGKARGARMSHYEFKQPMQNRLSDEQWQQMLKNNEVPKWQ